MTIDVTKLRRDMESNNLGAFFGGGFGGALSEMSDIKHATDEEVVKIAQRKGIDLSEYAVNK